jgi:hypothetical protein
MPAVTRGEPFLAARGSNPAGEADTKSSDTSAFSDAGLPNYAEFVQAITYQDFGLSVLRLLDHPRS